MLNFFRQYLRHPRSIGAIAPSSKKLARKMVQPIDFSGASCIMEFGPGTGVFTDELARRRKASTTLILIEQNKEFCKLLKQKYQGQKNLHIVHGSAAHAGAILKKHGFAHADYIVSGLPFASLPKETSGRIVHAIQQTIGRQGVFITFQYTLLKKSFFRQHFQFKDCIHVMGNLPPAYVFVMKSKQKKEKNYDSVYRKRP